MCRTFGTKRRFLRQIRNRPVGQKSIRRFRKPWLGRTIDNDLHHTPSRPRRLAGFNLDRERNVALATIETYVLANGAKRYRVRYRAPENKSTDKSGFTTKRDAQAFAATVEVSKLSGTYIAPAAGRVTVGEVARLWLDSSMATVKATTMAKHESAWSFRVQPRWGAVAIGDVRPPAIKAWVAEMHASGVGAASIESALDVLRGALGAALDDRAIVMNPAAGVKPPRACLLTDSE